jgi:hypothetical protein
MPRGRPKKNVATPPSNKHGFYVINHDCNNAENYAEPFTTLDEALEYIAAEFEDNLEYMEILEVIQTYDVKSEKCHAIPNGNIGAKA